MTAPTHLSALAADLHASQRLYEETRLLLDQALKDRDDSRRELAEQKRINTSNLRVMTQQLDQARQTLADAPHDTANGCRFGWHKTLPDLSMGDALPCTCWKAGL